MGFDFGWFIVFALFVCLGGLFAGLLCFGFGLYCVGWLTLRWFVLDLMLVCLDCVVIWVLILVLVCWLALIGVLGVYFAYWCFRFGVVLPCLGFECLCYFGLVSHVFTLV